MIQFTFRAWCPNENKYVYLRLYRGGSYQIEGFGLTPKDRPTNIGDWEMVEND